MSMLPQPPPNAPAPPPSEAALRSRRYWWWIWIVGVISVVGCFALLRPRTGCKRSPQTEAVNNARQVGLALFEFEMEYGKFPDATTIAPVQNATDSVLPSETVTSNDFFRQLLASGIAQSEAMFYARISGARKPDGVFTDVQALEKGECGFTYFLGGNVAGNPSRPLVAAPMIPGTDRFDPKPFEGKAVVLKMDCSVTSLAIDKDGHVIIDGRNMMDPRHPIWDGHAPIIAWPE